MYHLRESNFYITSRFMQHIYAYHLIITTTENTSALKY